MYMFNSSILYGFRIPNILNTPYTEEFRIIRKRVERERERSEFFVTFKSRMVACVIYWFQLHINYNILYLYRLFSPQINILRLYQFCYIIRSIKYFTTPPRRLLLVEILHMFHATFRYLLC